MRVNDKVGASPGLYLMLLSDCTAPTISQSLHPLSTSLKHSHRHHRRGIQTPARTHSHTSTRAIQHSNILNTVSAYWLLWHAPIVEQMVHLISCEMELFCVISRGKDIKWLFSHLFRKAERGKKRRNLREKSRSCALTSMSVSSLIKHKHGIIDLEDTREVLTLA